MKEENLSASELWRWKLMRKLADFVNKPDDVTSSELKAMIESYRDYTNLKQFFPGNVVND